jgi:hypothetical protein
MRGGPCRSYYFRDGAVLRDLYLRIIEAAHEIHCPWLAKPLASQPCDSNRMHLQSANASVGEVSLVQPQLNGWVCGVVYVDAKGLAAGEVTVNSS